MNPIRLDMNPSCMSTFANTLTGLKSHFVTSTSRPTDRFDVTPPVGMRASLNSTTSSMTETSMPPQPPDVHTVPMEAVMETMKAELLRRIAREHATTMRVIRALPEAECDFRPHERSSTALAILATLAREQAGMMAVLDGTWTMPPSFPAPPETWNSGVAMLDAGAANVSAALERTPPIRLAESVPFFTGPRTVGLIAIYELLWFWLLDAVHHRGQLSVYVRMAGGRVPSIYGPSADEPWS
jgi:uncharacterized damage-inducible protein DinB